MVESSKARGIGMFSHPRMVEGNVSEIDCTCYIKLQDLKALFVNVETI